MVVLDAVPMQCVAAQYYERLRAASKPGMVAVIASTRKLLRGSGTWRLIGKPFVPQLSAMGFATGRELHA
jgi:hypothetical protein